MLKGLVMLMEKDKKSSSLEEIQLANQHAALCPEFRKAPPRWLSLGNHIIRVERGRGLACMLVCERESVSWLGRWMLVLRRQDWDTHTCMHTQTRVRQRSDRLPGDGAHHRSACWPTEEVGTELCL